MVGRKDADPESEAHLGEAPGGSLFSRVGHPNAANESQVVLLI